MKSALNEINGIKFSRTAPHIIHHH